MMLVCAARHYQFIDTLCVQFRLPVICPSCPTSNPYTAAQVRLDAAPKVNFCARSGSLTCYLPAVCSWDVSPGSFLELIHFLKEA